MKAELSISINELKGDMEYIKAQVSNLNDRMEGCEHRMAKMEDELDTRVKEIEDKLPNTISDFSPEMTLVAINLPDNGTSPTDQARKLLEEGIGTQKPFVRAKRLPGKDGRPGIIKIQCQSKEDN